MLGKLLETPQWAKRGCGLGRATGLGKCRVVEMTAGLPRRSTRAAPLLRGRAWTRNAGGYRLSIVRVDPYGAGFRSPTANWAAQGRLELTSAGA